MALESRAKGRFQHIVCRSPRIPASVSICGSLFIGLSLGALAMVMDYTHRNPLGFVAPLFFLALPIIDTIYVMFLRARAGRKIYYGSPDHIPLRLRKRLGGSTVRTVVVCYGAAVVFGGIGLGILYLDPVQTTVVIGVVGAVVLGILIWLSRVKMEAP